MDETTPQQREQDAIERGQEISEPAPTADEHADVLTPDQAGAQSGPKRAGCTKNHGQKRNKARARMAKTSRVRNR